jgi:hypothetical protein
LSWYIVLRATGQCKKWLAVVAMAAAMGVAAVARAAGCRR